MTDFFEILGMILYCFLILIFISGFIALIYLCWLEYKLEKSIIDETHAHNGTCIDKGYYYSCSYQGDRTTIINSNSKCYINDIEVNCLEINNGMVR